MVPLASFTQSDCHDLLRSVTGRGNAGEGMPARGGSSNVTRSPGHVQATRHSRPWTLTLILAAPVTLGCLFWLVVSWLPEVVYPSIDLADVRGEGLTPKDRYDVVNARLQLQAGFRETMLQGLAGLLAVSGAVLAWRQFVQERAEKRDDFHLDLFGQALDGLGSDQVEVRIGGMYAFARLAQLSSTYGAACGDVLLAYVRERRRIENGPPDFSAEAPAMPADVQTALRLLVSKPPDFYGSTGMNLSDLDLSGRADLVKGYLTGADLRGTRLTDALISGACLVGTNLTDACLLRADLRGTNLQRSTLVNTDLSGADLTGADITQAHCSEVTWPRGFSAPPSPDVTSAQPLVPRR